MILHAGAAAAGAGVAVIAAFARTHRLEVRDFGTRVAGVVATRAKNLIEQCMLVEAHVLRIGIMKNRFQLSLSMLYATHVSA